jgi:hypothetical protein
MRGRRRRGRRVRLGAAMSVSLRTANKELEEEVDAALLAGEARASQLNDCSQPRPQRGNDREQ